MRALCLLMALMVASPALADSASDRLRNAAKEPITTAERIETAKMMFSVMLKDAESARFRNVELVKTVFGTVICGEVNAKNGMGGYIGFTEFVTAGSALFLDEGDAIERLAAEQQIHYMCGHASPPTGQTRTKLQF